MKTGRLLLVALLIASPAFAQVHGDAVSMGRGNLVNPSATASQAIFGQINVNDFSAKGDGRSVSDVSTTISTTINSASASFTQADVGKLARLYNVGPAELLNTTVATTVGNANNITINGLTDYAATGNGVVIFKWHGAEVTYSNCTWPAASSAVTCPSLNAFPIATPAMWDGGIWPIKLLAAKAGNVTTTITAVNAASQAVVGIAPSLTKSNATILYGTDNCVAVNAATISLTALNTFAQVTGAVMFPPGVYLTSCKIRVYGATTLIGPGPGGKPVNQISGASSTQPLLSGIVSFIKSPAAIALTAATNSTTGVFSFTSATAHGLEANQAVKIAGVTPSTYNSAANGNWIVVTTPTATTFTALAPAGTTGIAAGSVFGTMQGQDALVEFSPYDTSVFPPTNTGATYFGGIEKMYLSGNSSDPPSAAILFNGAIAARFLRVEHVQIGTFPPTYGVPPTSVDPDPVGQFTDAILYAGADVSPAYINEIDAHSYNRFCVNRDTNISHTAFAMYNSQCKPDFTYGAGAFIFNSKENTVVNTAIIQNPEAAFTIDDGGAVVAIGGPVENNGQLIHFITNSVQGHSFTGIGGDWQLGAMSNPFDGVEVLSNVTGSSSIAFSGSAVFFAGVSGQGLYSGPAFTWQYKAGANTHSQLLLNNVLSSGTHRFLTTSLDIVPTSDMADDMLLQASFLTGNATNQQFGPIQNWLYGPTSTVSFTRHDFPPSVTNVTAGNLNISQPSPLLPGDVLAFGNTTGQTAFATLPTILNTMKYNGGAYPTKTCGAIWRVNEAAGNIADSCNSNTGVKSGAGGTYQSASLTQDDADYALITLAGGPLYTVATDASLPSGDVFTTCFSFKKATDATLMTVMEQKASGFHIQFGATNLLTIWKVNATNNIAGSNVAYTGVGKHRACITHDATPNTNVYVDDVNVTAQGTNYTDSLAPADATLYLFASAGDVNPWLGTLDEIVVTKTTYGKAQVDADYIEWAKQKYGTPLYVTDGTIGVAGALLTGAGTGAAAYYNLTGWVGTGY